MKFTKFFTFVSLSLSLSLFLFLFLGISSVSATTTRDVYVDPDATGTGDGTSWTNAYTSLFAAETGEQGDITLATGSDEIVVIHCKSSGGTADTTAVTIFDWTTSATNYIEIKTDTADRHSGVWDDTKYRLEIDGSLRIYEPHVRLDGLQINYPGTSDIHLISYGNVGADGGEQYISNSLIKNSGSAIRGIADFPDNSTIKIWNNIIYNFIHTGALIRGLNSTTYLYNNTFYLPSSSYGIYTDAGTVVAKNNIMRGSSNGYYGTFEASSDYNISDINGDAPNATFTTSPLTPSFISTAAGSEDFHLQSSDTSALDQGTDLSGDGNLAFSTDIDGDTRSGSWDIGADEYIATVAAASSVSPAFSLTQLYSPKITNVLINNITDVSAEITFDTDKDGNTQVLYGTEAFYNMFHSFSHIEFSWDEVKNHKSVLSDLKPSTTYYFTIKSKGPSNTGIDSNVYMFDTLGTETVSETTQATTTETTTTTTTTTDNTTVVTETTTTTEVTGGETENQKQIDFLKSQITSFAEILRDTISKFRERLKEQSIKIQNQASVINSDIFGVLKNFFRK